MPYKMPSAEYFLSKKKIYDKTDPVWVYLEREMREMSEKGIKPYNKAVGEWLQFLKDLKHHYSCEMKRKERQIKREIGPRWYFEFSPRQLDILAGLKEVIHQDIIEDLPNRMRRALAELGVTIKIRRSILMKAMLESEEDTGVFVWKLFTAVYKSPPSVLLPKYDLNAMILMSSMVFIDLEECIQKLEELTKCNKEPVTEKVKGPKKYFEPNIRYGMYLSKMYAHDGSNSSKKKDNKPLPLGNKLKVRSTKSYEMLCQNISFLEKRLERNRKAIKAEVICDYPFWEPPAGFRNMNPKDAALALKMRMIKLKAKPKFKAPFKNVQYLVSGVVFCNGKPHYCLGNVALLPTGYMPINGGLVPVNGDYMSKIDGFWKLPQEVRKKCPKTCSCVEEWEEATMNYLKESKCKCDHRYDFHLKKKTVEKFFHPPTRHGPYFLDKAKVYQFDKTEDFIKDCVSYALQSREPTPSPSQTILASAMKDKDLLRALLAELTDSPCIIPHLPQSHLLNNLLEWTRKRMRGEVDAKQTRKWLLQSQRRWQYLKHRDFRSRAYQIPFTIKQLEHMTYDNINMIMHLCHVLLDNFISRNQIQQFQQSRYWWATTKSDAYPSKKFLEIFFTYMPSRPKDTLLINPYCSINTPKNVGKTCPLGF